MMPRISPSVTEKVTSLTARNPPNERDNPVTCSSEPVLCARATCGAGAATAGAATAGGASDGKARRNQRSRIVQYNPSGAASMMMMIAAPYTTPWIPGR